MPTVLDFATPRLLRNEAEYDAAIQEIERLLDLDPPVGSDDYERLEFLSVLAEAYEEERYPFDRSSVTPQDAVDFMLEQKGITRAELAPHMGGRSRVSEFFTGRRPLSRKQIETLRDLLGIPADLLL